MFFPLLQQKTFEAPVAAPTKPTVNEPGKAAQKEKIKVKSEHGRNQPPKKKKR